MGGGGRHVGSVERGGVGRLGDRLYTELRSQFGGELPCPAQISPGDLPDRSDPAHRPGVGSRLGAGAEDRQHGGVRAREQPRGQRHAPVRIAVPSSSAAGSPVSGSNARMIARGRVIVRST
jgi:hypothetical protein